METSSWNKSLANQNSPTTGSFDLLENLFLSQFLDASVQARLFASGGVLLDHLFLCCFVDGLLGLLVPFLSDSEVTFLNSIESLLDRALDHSFDGAVTSRVGLGYPHVFLG